MKNFLKFDYKKTVQAINFFLHEQKRGIDKLKILKLIYLTERYHLRKYGRLIFNDIYYAMKLGPVGSSTKDFIEFSPLMDNIEREYCARYISKSQNENYIDSIGELDGDILSSTEIESLNFVKKFFFNRNTTDLVNIVHIYPEWKKYENQLKQGVSRIQMSYLDFFENPNTPDLLSVNFVKDPYKLDGRIIDSSKEYFIDFREDLDI